MATGGRDLVDDVLESLRRAESHVSTEYQDDLSITLATVTKTDPRYAMMPIPGKIHVVTDTAGVADFYRTSRSVFQPLGLRMKAQLTTDWFMFLEGVASRRARDTGQEYTTSTVTLFPTTEGGIVGEFLWERYNGEPRGDGGAAQIVAEAKRRGARSEVPVMSVLALRIHDDIVHALRNNDLDALCARFADDYLQANRSYVPSYGPMVQAEGLAGAREYWGAFLQAYRVDDVSTINRLTADWYVFAELVLTVTPRESDGAQKRFRTATIYPIRADGRVMGELGYGTPMQPAPANAPRRLGIAVYGRADFNDPLQWPANGGATS